MSLLVLVTVCYYTKVIRFDDFFQNQAKQENVESNSFCVVMVSYLQFLRLVGKMVR